MRAFANHFSFEFRTGLRNKNLLMLNYLFPLGFYAMMGLMMTQINPLFKETMIPAMAVFGVLSATILGLPSPLVEAREAGIFRSFKINGVPAVSILSIPALTTMFHSLIVAAVIAATGTPLFDAAPVANWGIFALVALLTAFVCAGLGSLIGVISANTRVTVLWSQMLYLPSMLISGMMVPLSMLPAAFSRIALLLPPTYALQAFRGLALDQPAAISPLWSVVILLAGGVLAFALAIYLFDWDRHNAARRGHPLMALLALLPYVAGMVLLG